MDDYTQSLITTITTLSHLLVDKSTEADIAKSSLQSLQETHAGLQEDHSWLKQDVETMRRESRTIEHVQNTKDNLHRQLNTTMLLFSQPDLMVNLTTFMNRVGQTMYRSNKIRLIKEVIELTKPLHWGLKQAKDFIESYPWRDLETSDTLPPPIGTGLHPCKECGTTTLEHPSSCPVGAEEEELSRTGHTSSPSMETVGDGDPLYIVTTHSDANP